MNDFMNDKQRMLDGKLFNPQATELLSLRKHANKFNKKYLKKIKKAKKRNKLLNKYISNVGENTSIEAPFYIDYGFNINIGDSFFAKRDCKMLDSGQIIIGNGVIFESNVTLQTSIYPLNYKERNSGLISSQKIIIEDNVLIKAGSLISAGVTIGQGSVILPGSAVTSNVPKNVVAGGNPAKVINEIDDNDLANYKDKILEYYEHI